MNQYLKRNGVTAGSLGQSTKITKAKTKVAKAPAVKKLAELKAKPAVEEVAEELEVTEVTEQE